MGYLFYFSQMLLCIFIYNALGFNQKKCYISDVFFLTISGCILSLAIQKCFGDSLIIKYAIYLVILIFAKIIYDKSFKETFYDFFTVYVMLFFIHSLGMIIFKMIYPRLNDYLNVPAGVEDILMMGMYFCIFLYIYHEDSGITEKIHSYKTTIKQHPAIIFQLGLTVLTVQKMWRVFPYFIWNNFFGCTLMVGLLLFLNLLGLKRSTEVYEQKKVIHMYQQYTPVLNDMVGDIKKKQHEFKNHMNVMNQILYNKNQIEAPELGEYVETVSEISSDSCMLMELKDKIVAALIYEKLSEANKKSITFDCHIEHVEYQPLKTYQLIEVLGNLIDNAFHAAFFSKNKQKHVILEMNAHEEGRVITVKNNGNLLKPSEIHKIFQCGYSTKGSGRGYGLFNVKSILDAVNGSMEVSNEGEYTTFKVIF